MTGMNEQVREAVRQAMKKQQLTQAEMAQRLETSQPALAKMLTGRVGKVPDQWQKLLDELGLELVALPKKTY